MIQVVFGQLIGGGRVVTIAKELLPEVGLPGEIIIIEGESYVIIQRRWSVTGGRELYCYVDVTKAFTK